jgi:hypothetical protein
MRVTRTLGLWILCALMSGYLSPQPAHSQAYPGYTLYGRNNGSASYLINLSNGSVHTWTHNRNGGYSVVLLEDGSVLRSAASNNSTFNGGGA